MTRYDMLRYIYYEGFEHGIRKIILIYFKIMSPNNDEV